jgi:FAD/FMN-containing dehydrogenase
VLASAASLAAHRLGYRIVTGTCTSIGIAGGYSMGGGFSALSSLYGLAADNVLEWEVVTADGTHTTASPSVNRDLYWALSGGGGGTFAVAVAMTARLHRDDAPTAGAALSFNASAAPSAEAYWGAGAPFLRGLPAAVDADAVVGLAWFNTSTSIIVSAPGQSPDQVRALLRPSVDYLERHGIPYALDVTSHATYREHFLRYFNFPGQAGLISSRVIPRDAALSETASASPAALTRLGRRVVAEPGFRTTVIGVRAPPFRLRSSASHLSPPRASPEYDDDKRYNSTVVAPSDSVNSVHPAWREAVALVLVETAVDADKNELQAAAVDRQATFMKNVVDPALVELAPGSAPYLNEANVDMPDLVRATFGPNLARLRRIKAKWDADDVFYAPSGVGSDEWALDSEGRLCRAKWRTG